MKPLYSKLDFISGREHFTKPKVYIWDKIIQGYGSIKCLRIAYEKNGCVPQARGLTQAVMDVWDFSKNSEKELNSTVKNLSSIWNTNFNQIMTYFEGGYNKLDETFNTTPILSSMNQPKKHNKDPKFILKYAENLVDEFNGDKNSINQLITILQTLDLS